MSIPVPVFTVATEHDGKTLSAILRLMCPDKSWSDVKNLITRRRLSLNGTLCMDPARRVKRGDKVELLAKSAPVVPGERPETVPIRHLDDSVVVVEKPSGVSTMRHPAEREWDEDRRKLVPTLDDVTALAVAQRVGARKHELPRLRVVHRLDKDTSGLVVFARTVDAERFLGRQFKEHTVVRRYIAVVHGTVTPRTISSWLARDRGDGRRGSGPEGQGKHAVTHVDVLERLGDYSIVACQLETGRTHQIRIHLSEAGHLVCGEPVYNHRRDQSITEDRSEAPRLALHAAELGFVHPTTQQKMFWQMPPPPDLERFIQRLREKSRG